jgi:hypothetical protein
MTPLMFTTPHAPGAAKLLLNWPTADANITERYGKSFLDRIRLTVTEFSDKVALPDNPRQIQDHSQLEQWATWKKCWWKGEPALVTGITTLE